MYVSSDAPNGTVPPNLSQLRRDFRYPLTLQRTRNNQGQIWLRLNSERFQYETVLQLLRPSRQDTPEKSGLNRIKIHSLNMF